jgi:hypothetical protein
MYQKQDQSASEALRIFKSIYPAFMEADTATWAKIKDEIEQNIYPYYHQNPRRTTFTWRDKDKEEGVTLKFYCWHTSGHSYEGTFKFNKNQIYLFRQSANDIGVGSSTYRIENNIVQCAFTPECHDLSKAHGSFVFFKELFDVPSLKAWRDSVPVIEPVFQAFVLKDAQLPENEIANLSITQKLTGDSEGKKEPASFSMGAACTNAPTEKPTLESLMLKYPDLIVRADIQNSSPKKITFKWEDLPKDEHENLWSAVKMLSGKNRDWYITGAESCASNVVSLHVRRNASEQQNLEFDTLLETCFSIRQYEINKKKASNPQESMSSERGISAFTSQSMFQPATQTETGSLKSRSSEVKFHVG